MSLLATPLASLPATTPELLDRLDALQAALVGNEPVDVATDHVIHAGMYARTITAPRDMVLVGVLIKRPTLVITTGSVAVLGGDGWHELAGYNVIPASAGRKQVYVTRSTVTITMVFPTQARTVEEAETEFTDDTAALLSRRQHANTVAITGE